MNLVIGCLSLLTVRSVLSWRLIVVAITTVGPTISAYATNLVDSMTNEITATQLRQHVLHLAGTIGERNVFRPQALRAAQEYIEATWHGQGYEIVTQEYSVNGVRSANLEVTRTGVRYPEQIILIGAHYDSVYGSPGANDNGSGVATLLELSRLFVAVEPEKSVRFVAFTNEEPPFYTTDQQGSMVYARDARKRGDNIQFMVALETIGSYSNIPGSQSYPPLFRFFYPDQGNFIAFVSNFGSRHVMRKLVRAYQTSTDFPVEHVATFAAIPGISWSDHRSFWHQDYDAFMITDTAFYRYPYYHSSEDTPEKLNYDEFASMANGLFKALLLIAAGVD
jgi:hypothetical protein